METKTVFDTSVFTPSAPLTLTDAIALVQEHIEDYLANRPITEQYHQLRIPITIKNPLQWLSAQTLPPSLFWESRDKTFLTAAIGAVEKIEGNNGGGISHVLNAIRTKLSANEPQLRFYGGFRFDSNTPSAIEWNPFGRSYFSLPRFELQRVDKQMFLVVNLRTDDTTETIQTLLSQIEPAEQFTTDEPIFADEINERPIRAEWETQVNLALSKFSPNHLQKVVLSRQQIINCVTPVDPATLLSRVASHSGVGVSFLLSPDAHSYFLGHSPERLYQREGRMIQTEAVAGTRMRGATDAEDTRLAQELLSSEKEQREQQVVSLHIADKLQKLCDQVTIPSTPHILKLTRLQHLVTSFSGLLHDNITDADIVSALHPTPAVAGYPVADALSFLSTHESYDRGWYAGPIGWVGYDSAEFVVAIRSALVQGHTVRLFAGSGIVAGSVASIEWEETEQKLGGFRKLFSQ